MLKSQIERQKRLKRASDNAAVRRKVDYMCFRNDFMTVMWARMGLQSDAIAKLTGLSISQVNYRIQKSEREDRYLSQENGKKYLTLRKRFRMGISPTAKILMGQMSSKSSPIRKNIIDDLDKNGLYHPTH